MLPRRQPSHTQRWAPTGARLLATVLATGLATVLASGAALGATPRASQPNTCTDFDTTTVCATNADCKGNTTATVCAGTIGAGGAFTGGRCVPSCKAATGANPAACALGETCREGVLPDKSKSWVCQPTNFRVDLNLLDLAVTHHVLGTEPAGSSDPCSLARNLDRLLDQDGDEDFDIFDLDLAVVAFLERTPCVDAGGGRCAAPNDDLVPCKVDATCGTGLHCDPTIHACTRECGRVASRELGAGALDRECFGTAETCDRALGRCVEIENWQELGCAVDGDCPNGTYCFLGQCAAVCYSAGDCPQGGFTCSATNRCHPVAALGDGGDAGADPARFAIRFLRDELQLSGVRISDSTALAIMDKITGRQQVGQPGLVFGYRLSVEYGIKQDAQCLNRTFVDCDDPKQLGDESQADCKAIQSDCLIDGKTESWIRLPNPFGTVSGAGSSQIAVDLDDAIADTLSPGKYPATVRAIFDNGESDSIDVVLTKASPSGTYAGTLVVAGASGVAMNADRPTALNLKLYVSDTVKKWTTVMAENHIVAEQGTLIDQNQGRVVTGLLDGDVSFGFARSGTGAAGSGDIPFVGIYQPDKRRIRIIGFIDIPADFCITEDGVNCSSVPDTGDGTLRVQNPFGRRIVRQIELAGQFDDATAVFNGTYTETIHGLSTAAVTLLGSFVLTQAISDNTPVVLGGPLLAAELPVTSLPLSQSLALASLGQGPDACAGEAVEEATAMLNFASQATFGCYLDHAERLGVAIGNGQTTEDLGCGQTKPGPAIFPALAAFNEGPIKDAIASLASGIGAGMTDEQKANATSYLNIYDFLSGWLESCDPDDATPPPVCIRSDEARCGLALYQKALISGWVPTDQVTVATGGDKKTLFCSDLINLSAAACPNTAGAASGPQRALFALQEHNRFWSSLAQSLKFDADRARSDAFLTLFRHQFNPFVAGAALTYKEERLTRSLQRYDALVQLVTGSAGAFVLYGWPATAFEANGQPWLNLLYTILEDRMDVVSELVDLRVRVLETLSGTQSFRFVGHMMQNEYLVQVLMTDLQREWQGGLAKPAGEAGRIFARGQSVLNRLRSGRNALGIQDGKTFFESTDPKLPNWLWYRNKIVGEDGSSGLLADAEADVQQAIADLQGSLKDLDALENSLDDEHTALQDTVSQICGDPGILLDSAQGTGDCANLSASTDAATVNSCYCNAIFANYVQPNVQLWQEGIACLTGESKAPGQTCPDDVQIDCPNIATSAGVNIYGGNEICRDLKTTFAPDTLGSLTGNPSPDGPGAGNTEASCTFDAEVATFQVNGHTRFCLGGEMRALLQEKASVDIQRMHTIHSLGDMLGEFVWRAEHYKTVTTITSVTATIKTVMQIVRAGIGFAREITETVNKVTDATGGAIDCELIAGLAVGTDCPMSFAGGAVKIVGTTVTSIADNIGLLIATALEQAENIIDLAAEGTTAEADFLLELKGLQAEAGNIVDAYQVANQAAFNLATQIQAKREALLYAVDRWNGNVSNVADHLIGRESGYVLRADHLVGKGSQSFQTLMATAHKMVMAFGHSRNLSKDTLDQLVTLAHRAVTLDDVKDLVALLDSMDQSYCGQWGIDCDASNNVETVRISLRQLLFPSLRDIVSAKTGTVLTAGQQFHNRITAPPYVKRRVRGAYTTDQIEIDLYVALQMQEQGASGPSWQIDPFGCNQQLTGDNPEGGNKNLGTVAVDVVGRNLATAPGQKVRYQLLRGPTDFMRGCGLENEQLDFGLDPVLAWPINTFLVGYPPQNPKADLDTVPTFFTVSSMFEACMHPTDPGEITGDDACWRLFARDRSLATPELQLIIPLRVNDASTDSTWVLGDGLPEDERPVMDDIVVYFRYRTRPVLEN